MKPVRVGSALYVVGPLACPRCNRPAYESAIGILRLTCEGSRCHQSWTAIRLPPGATRTLVFELYGEVVVEALRLDSLAPLVYATDGPTYLQRAPDQPEPLMGWREAQAVMQHVFPNNGAAA